MNQRLPALALIALGLALLLTGILLRITPLALIGVAEPILIVLYGRWTDRPVIHVSAVHNIRGGDPVVDFDITNRGRRSTHIDRIGTEPDAKDEVQWVPKHKVRNRGGPSLSPLRWSLAPDDPPLSGYFDAGDVQRRTIVIEYEHGSKRHREGIRERAL